MGIIQTDIPDIAKQCLAIVKTINQIRKIQRISWPALN